jgi:methyl-accepting chemotaxis protein
MTPTTVAIVRHSWRQVHALGPQAGVLFYANLFAADPALQPLFKGDITQQGAKLLQMIGAAVAKLDDLDTLLPILRNMGQRHAGYGVMPAHYTTVGGALLQTLEQGLGDHFTPPVRAAWTEVYGVIAEVMLSAAEATA